MSPLLRYNWLTRHNPLIDWVLSSIAFHPPSQGMPSTPMSPQLALAAEEPLDSPGPSPDTIEYLGYLLSPEGLTMSPEKVKTV
ncbi:hypothetical protein AZE42_11569 [Rhizopogon vesiculosus]|uniref:Uncharacterized protein n=1 Tax=Rhizopogon vesiculosus TaxID=180088 RepID=A0A1J8PRW9_9AGAM|nr:hypothetical protein AZE42_11569 [Rhizopogon vesiculosus]